MTELKDKVTLEDINAAINTVAYHVFPGTTVTTCLITLKNGTNILGKNYGRINPDQQDWEMGKKYAYEDAVRQIWELEGYLIRQHLFEASKK